MLQRFTTCDRKEEIVEIQLYMFSTPGAVTLAAKLSQLLVQNIFSRPLLIAVPFD